MIEGVAGGGNDAVQVGWLRNVERTGLPMAVLAHGRHLWVNDAYRALVEVRIVRDVALLALRLLPLDHPGVPEAGPPQLVGLRGPAR